MIHSIILGFGILFASYVNCHKSAIYPDALPKSFTECEEYLISPSHTNEFIHAVQKHCLDGFISVDHTNRWAANFTTDEHNYIYSVFRKVIQDASELRKGRNKRDTSLFLKRERREVRALPYSNWLNYARNVVRLKYETILPNGRSKWDILADLHYVAVNSAHFGPNFLPWHRLYLIVMESALNAPIPYWESPIDFRMDDPTETILFTKKYFGNGFGFVKTGPFARFNTPLGRLFRNIGADGALMETEGVNNILRQSRYAQIVEPTAAEDASVEGQHDGVHNWVDGQMNNLEFSAHDPIFFTHHAFVDLIWELFRYNQRKRGIDPTSDIVSPPQNVTFQNITDPSVGLAGYYNSDGYSERIASMVRYSETLQCPVCGNCKDVYCDDIRNVCVSRRRNPREYAGIHSEAMDTAREHDMMNNGIHSKPFPLYQRDSRVRMDSSTLNYNDINNDEMNEEEIQNGPTMIRNSQLKKLHVFGRKVIVSTRNTQSSENIRNQGTRSGMRNEISNTRNILENHKMPFSRIFLTRGWDVQQTTFPMMSYPPFVFPSKYY